MTMDFGGVWDWTMTCLVFQRAVVLELKVQRAYSRGEKGWWKKCNISAGGNVKLLLTEASNLRLGTRGQNKNRWPIALLIYFYVSVSQRVENLVLPPLLPVSSSQPLDRIVGRDLLSIILCFSLLSFCMMFHMYLFGFSFCIFLQKDSLFSAWTHLCFFSPSFFLRHLKVFPWFFIPTSFSSSLSHDSSWQRPFFSSLCYFPFPRLFHYFSRLLSVSWPPIHDFSQHKRVLNNCDWRGWQGATGDLVCHLNTNLTRDSNSSLCLKRYWGFNVTSAMLRTCENRIYILWSC